MRAGARWEQCCKVIGLDSRTLQRWRASGLGDDLRSGPDSKVKNKLSEKERQKILEVSNSEEFRDLSPKQIVPKLADRGKYIASESTFYRVLRGKNQLHHRETSREPVNKPKEHVATGPNQVWSWDITYLRSPVRGQFYYLYLIVDVWSRKIIAWSVRDVESMDYAADLVCIAARSEGIEIDQVVLHSDNGGPMKGATMLATLQSLGITASFSRPSVSNDNPYSESLFRTLKYRPEYPKKPFVTIEEAEVWVASFVAWYNTEHLHSSILFVTPEQRHEGQDIDILKKRSIVYEAAKKRHPERWSRNTRSWTPNPTTTLNPDSKVPEKLKDAA